MKTQTNLRENYANFDDLTKKQNEYFTKPINLTVVILCLF